MFYQRRATKYEFIHIGFRKVVHFKQGDVDLHLGGIAKIFLSSYWATISRYKLISPSLLLDLQYSGYNAYATWAKSYILEKLRSKGSPLLLEAAHKDSTFHIHWDLGDGESMLLSEQEVLPLRYGLTDLWLGEIYDSLIFGKPRGKHTYTEVPYTSLLTHRNPEVRKKIKSLWGRKG